MWRQTPGQYSKFALGSQDGARTDVNAVCPFKCCQQASNLEYLKRCVQERSEVPRLVKARENRAALQASLADASEISPAGTESTVFASPDSPSAVPLSPEQVRQVQEKCTYLRSLAKGIMSIRGMSVTTASAAGAMSGTPASAAGTDSGEEEEESPIRKSSVARRGRDGGHGRRELVGTRRGPGVGRSDPVPFCPACRRSSLEQGEPGYEAVLPGELGNS